MTDLKVSSDIYPERMKKNTLILVSIVGNPVKIPEYRSRMLPVD